LRPALEGLSCRSNKIENSARARPVQTAPTGKTKRGDTMAEKVQDYIETDDERSEGHTDTRASNFSCENKDPHLGCDMGIDVQG
jgi:hypothetical protein